MKTLVLIFSLLFSMSVYAQNPNSNHNVSMEDIPGSQDSVRVIVQLKMDIPEEVETLELRVGPETGQGNFLALDFYHSKPTQKHKLKDREKEYLVDDNAMVSFTGVVEKTVISNKCSMSIIGKDISGNVIYNFSKKIK